VTRIVFFPTNQKREDETENLRWAGKSAVAMAILPKYMLHHLFKNTSMARNRSGALGTRHGIIAT